MQRTAIILAGQRPGVDPLAAHFGMELKALVPLADEPMLTHVVRSLYLCPDIDRIVVLGQQPDQLRAAVDKGGGAEIRQSGNGIASSLLTLLESGEVPLPWLVTTADHALLSEGMVDEFLHAAGGDLSVGMVEKQTMLASFPDAKRTWLHFSDGAWSGANLFAFDSQKVMPALRLWSRAEQDRKRAWKLFLHFGPLLALRALTRTIGLADGLNRAGKRLGLDARLVALSDPVAAIDVDKPEDHALAARIMASRRGL